ncbi:MAG: HNH endonuclease [Candidatus Cloacimonetes bacterium]|nr:HNH endonuclease [Candidatus Cloacimonadota bacterium]
MKERTLKSLFAFSHNRCAFPGCDEPIVTFEDQIVLGEICHIESSKPTGPRYNSELTGDKCDSIDNLLLLCRIHHKLIDANTMKFPVKVLRKMKNTHEDTTIKEIGIKEKQAGILLYQHHICVIGNVVIRNSEATITAHNVNIRGSKRLKVNKVPLENSIGANIYKKAYIEYLIHRYNELASENANRKSKFSHAAIRKNIKDNFGALSNDMPIDKFEDISRYLQRRIDRTMIARMKKASGKMYHSFEDHVRKMKGSEKK